MIAAGEVVERPASVIKELVENSFDAGATSVTVEIRGGGAAYIRVSDNGCGMAAEDAGIAFTRHATSKLADEKGLECIGTMGFRGEALAAISAVSKIEMTTRRACDSEGTRITLDAGDIQDMLPCGCPVGTVITVRDIFYNTPARLKFLKSDRSEASACQLTALRCALGRPDVSVRFIKDGSEEFFSPGDGRGDSCAYALLGRETATGLMPVTGDNDGIRVTGFASSPAAGRGNRAMQFFYCNGRFIKSQLLQAALEQAYKNSLLSGRYPSCVLYLDMSFASVDVNVHPAKTEVKFSAERRVFDTVYYAVLSALEAEKPLAPAVERLSPAPKEGFYKHMTAAEYRSSPLASGKQGTSEMQLRAPEEHYQTRLDLSSPASTVRAPQPQYTVSGHSAEKPRSAAPAPAYTAPKSYFSVSDGKTPAISPVSAPIQPPAEPACQHNVENCVQNVESPLVPEHKIVGEAMKTYIIVEQGDSLILIDKHAAHERMIFDMLKSRKSEIMSQTLLCPVTVRPSGDDAELIERNASLLGELGFEIEPFGERDYIVRALPADMDAGEVAPALEEICEKLRRGKAPDAQSARDEILHTVACKAAIKAGWDTSAKELERVADAVLSGQVKYCPHGRPVSVTMTRKDLDKQFKRIV